MAKNPITIAVTTTVTMCIIIYFLVDRKDSNLWLRLLEGRLSVGFWDILGTKGIEPQTLLFKGF